MGEGGRQWEGRKRAFLDEGLAFAKGQRGESAAVLRDAGEAGRQHVGSTERELEE